MKDMSLEELKAEQRKLDNEYSKHSRMTNSMNVEIDTKRKAGKGVTRLARSMAKHRDAAAIARLRAGIYEKEIASRGKTGGKTRRRRASSTRRNPRK